MNGKIKDKVSKSRVKKRTLALDSRDTGLAHWIQTRFSQKRGKKHIGKLTIQSFPIDQLIIISGLGGSYSTNKSHAITLLLNKLDRYKKEGIIKNHSKIDEKTINIEA